MNRRVKAFVLLFVFGLALQAGLAQKAEGPSPAAEQSRAWRKVLAFDVCDNGRDHKADLGKHRIVIARWEAGLGWDIGVFAYPLQPISDNLLENAHNWHGVQPWMVYAWMKHEDVYGDERIIPYDGGKSELKIVLVGCSTRKAADDKYEFTAGRIEIYHRP